uniref:CSON010449 protein n=1 Tax=Culicoides sonorensis TaxID=179676 RepID=A0A336M1U7_CULSO
MEFQYKELCLTDIAGLESSSDDFLSNGFHQFYNEFQDEGLDFFDTQLSCEISTWTDTQPEKDLIDHDYYYKDDQINFNHPENETNSHKSLDLDYILMDLPFDDVRDEIILDLPEKTALCNDSCSFFLKESAENLKLAPKMTPLEEEKPQKPLNPEISDQKPLICDFQGCGKSYAKPTHLKAHVKRHMNEKPYICHWPECKWRFSRSDELARHRRSHLGIKPYSCCFCSKSFARSDHLTKHRRVHEKKFNAMCKGEKQQIIWPAVPRGRPGRKPKSKTEAIDHQNSNNCNVKISV